MLARRIAFWPVMAFAVMLAEPEPQALAAPSFGYQTQIDSAWGVQSFATHPSGLVLAGAAETSATPDRVEVSRRDPGSTDFVSPTQISNPAKDSREVEVALDAAGNGFAIWRNMTDKQIEFAFDAAPVNSGGFSAASPISATGNTVSSPDLAVDPVGNALAIWRDSTDSDIEFSFRPVGANFQATHSEIQTAGTSPGAPFVAFDPAGNAVAVWTESVGTPAKQRVRVASRPATGTFDAPVFVSPDGDVASGPKLAIDPQGNVVIGYKNNTDDAIEVVTRAAGATGFSSPVPVETPGDPGDSDYFDIAAGPGGRAAVSFPNETDNTYKVAVREAADQPFGTPTVVSPNPSADDTRVAYDALGNLVVAWHQSGDNGLEAASRPVCTGRFSRAVDASGPDVAGGGLLIDVDHEGDPILSENSGLVFEGDSGAPPILSALSIPAEGVAGAPLDFSVNPLDTQPVADVSWRFGDGGGASGNGASHTYASPGTYEVTVSATDTRDNTCTERRTINVAAPPPPVLQPPDLEPDSAITGLPSSQAASKLTRFRGTATDPENLLARVEIAVLQISGGAKATARKKPKPRCRELRSDGKLRSVKLTNKRCSPKTFLAATGTGAWTFTLKRALPPGSYVLYSRAVDQAGNSETSFTSRDGNRKAFRLR